MQPTVFISSEAHEYLVLLQGLIYERTGKILTNRETIDLLCAQHSQLLNSMADNLPTHGKSTQAKDFAGRPNDHKQQRRRHTVQPLAAA